MSKIEIVVIKTESGDSCLYVDGNTIYPLESWDTAPHSPHEVGSSLVEAMGERAIFIQKEVDEPTDDEWGWSDLYDFAMGRKKDAPSLKG